MEQLTNKSYWENYYHKSQVSRQQIEQVCGRYDLFWDQLVAACNQPPKSIIEIGAYPGRYIAYLADRYELEATALDYNSDRTKIEEAFQTMGVTRYDIIQADFLKYEPIRQYDLVISNGFIEHFENYDEVLDRHCKYLAPGGSMLVMIPNKRYLREWYGRVVDYENLKMHNLSCMNLKTFRRFSERNNLDVLSLGYFGGFPYSVHQKLNFGQKIIHHAFRRVFKYLNPSIEKRPNKYLSGSIVGIFRPLFNSDSL
jgi:trans-aconitate methyltransferase